MTIVDLCTAVETKVSLGCTAGINTEVWHTLYEMISIPCMMGVGYDIGSTSPDNAIFRYINERLHES